jgi:hypothetical protein
MTGADHKYEIFIRWSVRPAGGSRMQSIWSWRKTDSAGLALVRGTDHGSMVECLRAARKHRGESDDTPIAIELQGREAPDAIGVVYLGGKDQEEGPGKQAASSGFGMRRLIEPSANSENPGASFTRIDAFSPQEREQLYARRDEDARNLAALTEDSALRSEFLPGGGSAASGALP